MEETEFTIIDHIDDIRVPGRVFAEPTNEYWALICLWHGLDFLNRNVEANSQVVAKRTNPESKFVGLIHGNHDSFRDVPMPLLTCAFHWYAVTACNFVRTIGAIAKRLDSSRPLPDKYAEAVIPEVKAFRDKVAAHFAWNSLNKNDNDAERLASIIPQLGFSLTNNSFVMGQFNVFRSIGGKECTSENIMPWSVCGVHERLRQRYFPEKAESSDKSS